MRLHLPVALVAGLALGGCEVIEEGEVYPIPEAEVRAEIGELPIPFVLLGTSVAGIDARPQGDGSIRIVIRDAQGGSRGEVLALVRAESETETRVSVKLGEGRHPKPHVADLQRAMIEEQIDAELEDRGFRFSAIQAEFARAAGTEMPRMRDDMRRAMEASSKRDAAAIEQAYRDEAEGRW